MFGSTQTILHTLTDSFVAEDWTTPSALEFTERAAPSESPVSPGWRAPPAARRAHQERTWEWKEGRMLAYELVLQYLCNQHYQTMFPGSPEPSAGKKLSPPSSYRSMANVSADSGSSAGNGGHRSSLPYGFSLPPGSIMAAASLSTRTPGKLVRADTSGSDHLGVGGMSDLTPSPLHPQTRVRLNAFRRLHLDMSSEWPAVPHVMLTLFGLLRGTHKPFLASRGKKRAPFWVASRISLSPFRWPTTFWSLNAGWHLAAFPMMVMRSPGAFRVPLVYALAALVV